MLSLSWLTYLGTPLYIDEVLCSACALTVFKSSSCAHQLFEVCALPMSLTSQYHARSPKTEEELLELEEALIQEGFDAILLSKVIGVEERVTLVSAIRNIDRNYNSFRDDYYQNQEIYYDHDYYESFQVFHAQSSLYCICPDKERETIWRGTLEVTEPGNIKTAINDYVKTLIWILTQQELLMQ